VPLGQKQLFSQLIAKPLALWIRKSNREKYLALVPEPIRVHMDREEMMVTSLFIGNKALGILYADFPQGAEQSSRKFERFKQYAQRICIEFLKAKRQKR